MQATHVPVPLTTYAELLWPKGRGLPGTLRALILVVAGSALLALSAKVSVPGPVPMTLQTLAVLALGAMLGGRLAVASVLLYLAEGGAGLPVFADTPPVPAGPAYLMGPTAGYLVGFVIAAAGVGIAADRGPVRKPLAFAAILVGADLAVMLAGWVWLAAFVPGHGTGGIGWLRALQVGVAPFLLGEAIKVALAGLALPLVLDRLSRLLGR